MKSKLTSAMIEALRRLGNGISLDAPPGVLWVTIESLESRGLIRARLEKNGYKSELTRAGFLRLRETTNVKLESWRLDGSEHFSTFGYRCPIVNFVEVRAAWRKYSVGIAAWLTAAEAQRNKTQFQYAVISPNDIGYSLFEAFGREWYVSDFLNRHIRRADVGRRVFLRSEFDLPYLQIESDTQYSARLQKRPPPVDVRRFLADE